MAGVWDVEVDVDAEEDLDVEAEVEEDREARVDVGATDISGMLWRASACEAVAFHSLL